MRSGVASPAGKHTAAGTDSTERGVGSRRKVQPFQLPGAEEVQVVYRAQDRQIPFRQLPTQRVAPLLIGGT